MKDWIRLIRIKHWVKNIIIFLPMFFSQTVDSKTIWTSCIAFLSFSILASSVYVINDVVDVEKDRVHSVKCNRPIASGRIPIKSAMMGHCVLVGLSFVIFLGMCSAVNYVGALLLLVAYYLINIIYTLRGKQIPIMDIVMLSSGFIIRLFFGASVTGIAISEWLFLVIVAGAFYLALGKRRNELMKSNKSNYVESSRDVLKYYNYSFLDKSMNLCMSLIIVFYSLWCAEYGEKSGYLLFTVPLVLIIVMKYSLNIEMEDSDGDPTNTILGDAALLILVALLMAILFVIIYII